MREPIESAYFTWLRAKVIDFETPPYLYLDLLKILYRTEFVWCNQVLGDKNRIEDGKELRDHFLRETNVESFDRNWYNLPCSVLEVLIAFADRAAFQTDSTVMEWFWIFMKNLCLDDYRTVSDDDVDLIVRILETFIFRIYDPSGYGGLFPLREPHRDQRKTELWAQLFDYLEDQGVY